MVASSTSGKRHLLQPDALVLSGLLLLFVFVSFQVASRTSPSDDALGGTRHTTYSSRAGGWKAFYLLLQQEGAAVYRWEKEPSAWPRDARVVITGPEYFSLSNGGGGIWDKGEAEAAIKWVKAGGTLVLLADDSSELLKQLHLRVDGAAGIVTRRRVTMRVPPVQPTAFFAGVRTVVVPEETRWKAPPRSAVTLLADNKPLFVALPLGGGTVFAIASPGIADNEHLAQGDNARFLTQLVIGASGDRRHGVGRVLFDEYHQGYARAESVWAAVGRPGQLAALQIFVLTLLVAYSAGRRFGLPRPVPAPSRVSSEYVASLADLYRRAGAGDAALDGLTTAFRRDLCRSLGLPVDAPAPEVAAQAVRGLSERGLIENRLRVVLETPTDPAMKDDDLLRLAREIEDLRKELQLGGLR